MSFKNAYIEIKAQMDAAQHSLQDYEGKSRELQRRVTHLGGILVTLKDYICQKCQGRGEYWINYAQDDTKMEKCSACKGTGLPL